MPYNKTMNEHCKSNTYLCVVNPYVIVSRFMHMYNTNVPNI